VAQLFLFAEFRASSHVSHSLRKYIFPLNTTTYADSVRLTQRPRCNFDIGAAMSSHPDVLIDREAIPGRKIATLPRNSNPLRHSKIIN